MEDVLLREGVARMIAWPNYAPPALSPEVVPYRGFTTFPREIANATAIYALAPGAVAEYAQLRMGTYAANDYGFLVNELTSVEWGVLADGWSRAGWWSGILFIATAYWLVFGLERMAVTFLRFGPAAQMIFTGFLMSRLLRINSIPLLEFLRTTVLYVLVLVPFLLLLQRIFRLNDGERPTVGPGLPRPMAAS
jgi:hypothetical protein